LGYDRSALATIIKSLRDRGIDGVIVGSTCYMLYLGLKEFEDDIDLFTTTVSPTFDEDLIRSCSEELGCFLGQTEWGTPQLRCSVGGYEVVVELYENMYDFYIPQEMIDDAVSYKVNDVDVKALRVEDYLIIKSKSGREKDVADIQYLGDLIKSGDIRVDKGLMRRRLGLFEDFEVRLIRRRLEGIGIRL